MTSLAWNTQELRGNWSRGWAVDFHTLRSVCIGHNADGTPMFETIRSDMGDLVYRLKYKADRSVLTQIVDLLLRAFDFNHIDFIIPAPPSKEVRTLQPVREIAESLGSRIGSPVRTDAIRKKPGSPELKNIFDPELRMSALANAFECSNTQGLAGGNILVLDDLYRSGATLTAITAMLYREAGVSDVTVIAMTKTRVTK